MSHQTHPFINIVCSTLKEIEENLIYDPAKALLKMNHLLRAVDPEKRETCKDYSPTLEAVKDLIQKRASIFSAGPGKYERLKSEFDHRNYEKSVELYDRVWSLMWECGYMFDATFRVEIKEDKPIGG